MSAGKFHHFGVPTDARNENESFIEGGRVYVTDPEKHPYRVEFLRFESDSPMPDMVRNRPHAAFVVDGLDEALQGQNVIIPPFEAMENVRVAFIQDGDAVIELMEIS